MRHGCVRFCHQLKENEIIRGMLWTAHYIWITMLAFLLWHESQNLKRWMYFFIFYDSLHSLATVLQHCTYTQDSGPGLPFSSLPNLILNAKDHLWDLLSHSKSVLWCKLNLIVVKVAVIWGTHSLWGGSWREQMEAGYAMKVWFSVSMYDFPWYFEKQRDNL